MPDDVAARLDAAMAAARVSYDDNAASDGLPTVAPPGVFGAASHPATPHSGAARGPASGSGGSSDQPAGSPVTPLRRRRRWWSDSRVLQAAAALVLVLAGVGVGVPLVQNRGGNDSIGATAGSSTEQKAGGAAADRQSALGGTTILATGTDYTRETLPRDVRRVLAASSTAAEESGRLSADTNERRLAEPAALQRCVAVLAGRPATPVLVDVARFEQQPATVIVLDLPDDPERLRVWVVAPTCGADGAQIRHQDTLPRP